MRRLIPSRPKRKREMAAYSERHYGEHTWRLKRPRVIIEHWAETGSAAAVYNTFAPNVPDPELHELPNVCAHFVVSGSGRIFQLVPLRIRCRHTVGLNWTAIGIEHTGFSDAEVLGEPPSDARLAAPHALPALPLPDQAPQRDRPQREPLARPTTASASRACAAQTHGDWRHQLDADLPPQAAAPRRC